jgi:hypothetical protein
MVCHIPFFWDSVAALVFTNRLLGVAVVGILGYVMTASLFEFLRSRKHAK